MLPVGWLFVAIPIAVVLTIWVTFTLTRLDRLHARVDAAQAALDAQLVRRAAALLQVAENSATGLTVDERIHFEDTSRAALNVDPSDRQAAENAVGRAVGDILRHAMPVGDEAAGELREAAARVLIARRFYNDAVRDTRTLRARRMPRFLHLAGRRAMPQFFDIDDTVPPVSPEPAGQPPAQPTVPTVQLRASTPHPDRPASGATKESS